MSLWVSSFYTAWQAFNSSNVPAAGGGWTFLGLTNTSTEKKKFANIEAGSH